MKKEQKREATRQTQFNLEQHISLLQSLKGVYNILENDQCFLGRSKDGSLIIFDKERLELKVQFSLKSFNPESKKPESKISFAEYLDWLKVTE